MANLVKKIRTSSGDLQIDYNALANLPSINNNLLINSDFRNPVNQRGETVYAEATERYGIDRWMIYNGVTETVNNGYITLTNTADITAWFAQKFEHPLYNSEYYTITVNVRNISGDINISIGNQDEVTTRHSLTTGINSFVVQPNEITSTMSQIAFALSAGSSMELIYVKLEEGKSPTKFTSRIFEEELAICRRYYRKYWTSMVFPQFYGNQYYGFLFDTPMRIHPQVKFFSILSVNDNSSVGASVEVYAQGVYKFHTISTYTNNAIIVPMLELDAEIY